MDRGVNVEAMSPKDKALWDLWGLIMRHFDEDGEAEGLIDAEIQKLGYRKVTTCEKCKAWPSDNDMSNMKDDDGADRRWCIIRGGYMRADDYCSAGEPKEVKPDV
jgi:uncharacterized membrane-anchored protein